MKRYRWRAQSADAARADAPPRESALKRRWLRVPSLWKREAREPGPSWRFASWLRGPGGSGKSAGPPAAAAPDLADARAGMVFFGSRRETRTWTDTLTEPTSAARARTAPPGSPQVAPAPAPPDAIPALVSTATTPSPAKASSSVAPAPATPPVAMVTPEGAPPTFPPPCLSPEPEALLPRSPEPGALIPSTPEPPMALPPVALPAAPDADMELHAFPDVDLGPSRLPLPPGPPLPMPVREERTESASPGAECPSASAATPAETPAASPLASPAVSPGAEDVRKRERRERKERKAEERASRDDRNARRDEERRRRKREGAVTGGLPPVTPPVRTPGVPLPGSASIPSSPAPDVRTPAPDPASAEAALAEGLDPLTFRPVGGLLQDPHSRKARSPKVSAPAPAAPEQLPGPPEPAVPELDEDAPVSLVEAEQEVEKALRAQRDAGDLELRLLGASPEKELPLGKRSKPASVPPKRSEPLAQPLRLVPADPQVPASLARAPKVRSPVRNDASSAGSLTRLKARPPELIMPSDEESDGQVSGRLTSPMHSSSFPWSRETPPTSETAAGAKRLGPLELLVAKEAEEAERRQNAWRQGLETREREFSGGGVQAAGPSTPRSTHSHRSGGSVHTQKSSSTARGRASEAETVATTSDFFGRVAAKIRTRMPRLRQRRSGAPGVSSDEEGGFDSSEGEHASQRDEEADLTMNAETFARFFPSVGVCPEEDNGEDDTRGNKNGERIVAAFKKMHPEYVTDVRMHTAMQEFNLSTRDMADHIEAFELLAKGKGYITWRDIKSTMESTLQHTVTDGEAQALVQGVTGHAGRPMNLFDFIRFATTSSTNFMYSLKPVVLHL